MNNLNKWLVLLCIIGGLSIITFCTLIYLSINRNISRPIPEVMEEYDVVAANKDKIYFFTHNKFKGQSTTYGWVYRNDSNSWINLDSNNINIKINAVVENKNNREFDVVIDFNENNTTSSLHLDSVIMNMSIRSRKNFNKAGGTSKHAYKTSTSGTIPMDNAAMLAGYDFNYKDIDINRLGIKTNWLVYFDKDGNFYHLDDTQVAAPSDDYYAHSFFAKYSGIENSIKYIPAYEITIDETIWSVLNLQDTTPNLVLTKMRQTDLEYFNNSYLTAVTDNEGGLGVLLNLN